MPKPIRVLIVGDLHCGHEVGLWSDKDLPMADGRELPLNSGQEHLLKCWRHLQALAKEEIKPDIVVVNGDLVDGEQRKSVGTEAVTTIIAAQVKAAKKLLEPLTSLAKELYVTRGCVTPGHRVLTADLRWVPVETLQVGDRLQAFDDEGPNRRWRSATVTRSQIEMADVFEVSLEDGRKIECTGDHPWLVGRGTALHWMKTCNLRVGRSRLVEFLPVWSEEQSRDAGWLAGVFDGEGTLSQKEHRNAWGLSMRLQFAQKEGVVLDAVRQGVLQRGYAFSNQVSTSGLRGAIHLHLKGGRAEAMRFLGSIRPHRLLARFDPDALGYLQSRGSHLVTQIRPLGIRPIAALTVDSGTYFVEGLAAHNTPYHDGVRGMIVEGIAEGLGATGPNAGWHSWSLLDLDVQGVVVNLQHSISVSSGLYRSTALDREGIWSALAGKEKMLPRADAVVRSHVHIFVRVEHPTKHILTVPAWQLQTEYMRKNSAYRMLPDIGAVVLELDPVAKKRGEDPISLRKIFYPLPEMRAWRSKAA